MKISRSAILVVLALTGAVRGFGQADPDVASVGSRSARPLGESLNPDGTIRFEKGLSGSLDPRGLEMVAEPGKPPRFIPTSTLSALEADATAEGVWDSRFTVSNSVTTFAVIDGSLFVAGDFTRIGDIAAKNVARWDGISWSALGAGIDGSVTALAVVGKDLFAGGRFEVRIGDKWASGIARWDGTSWSVPGTELRASQVRSMVVMGSELYAAGFFNTGQGYADDIAIWNGSEWRYLGMGSYGGGVKALAVQASELYAGGQFLFIGAAQVPAKNIARWDGSAWHPLGAGVDGSVECMAFMGGDLYVGGAVATDTTQWNGVARWNGSSWLPLGSGVQQVVDALAVMGSDLIVGGSLRTAGGVPVRGVAKWNGSAWSALGSGLGGPEEEYPWVEALAVVGEDLFVGGQFTLAGGERANNLARWSGGTWTPMGGTPGKGFDNVFGIGVRALAVSGSTVYAGGRFDRAAGEPAQNVAKWDGSSWSALGDGLSNLVWALVAEGTDLYAGGESLEILPFAGSSPGVVRWDGSSWSAVGTSLWGPVYALAVMGSNVYAGGYFTSLGGSPAGFLLKWNGSTWNALGAGLNNSVLALAGSGSDLYAAGYFTSAGGAPANYVAKWDGTAWSALGQGTNNVVLALAISGSDLYAGGYFTEAGGVPANHVARWNGVSWSALGQGTNDEVRALAVSGSDLYAGGGFTQAGATPAQWVARWNGSDWFPLGSGTDNTVEALAATGADVNVGGTFRSAGGKSSNFFGIWHSTGAVPPPEIRLRWEATDIPAGGTYKFRPCVIGTDRDAVLSIRNDGEYDLSLTLLPLTVGGADVEDFSIALQPGSPVLSSGETTFVVRFHPTSVGAKTAWVSISNDAPGGSPYVLNVTGMGVRDPRVRRRLAP